MAPEGSEQRRRALCSEAVLGFLGTFAFLALVQAVLNVLSPEPQIWPGILVLLLCLATWGWWRRHRARYSSRPSARARRTKDG
ncbi:hypothetical protein L1O03_02455 [Corynebacterium uropygiale]|uniref:Uncharacterized protein n=1 Tax=Corynebacterium uropygiale TaxID=1775911 RepID=A0A9X1QPX8_9CORY|nr:hypothetical protein [Corynebacterium uropygiale]MCF4006040.1 hypothetical protein [Corynebacterium uropygiale]